MVCQGHFSDAYVARILAAIPAGWHAVRRRGTATAAALAPDIIAVISGSPAQQAAQEVKVRFGGGAATGALTVPLGRLAVLLNASAPRPSNDVSPLS